MQWQPKIHQTVRVVFNRLLGDLCLNCSALEKKIVLDVLDALIGVLDQIQKFPALIEQKPKHHQPKGPTLPPIWCSDF